MSLRREATPALFTTLNERQRVALQDLARQISDAVKRIPARTEASSKGQSGKLRLQRERFNNLLFLHGRRGMGKTTVMLTLLDLIQDEEAEGASLFKSIEADNLSKRVICLPPLEMDVLPASSNLLAAILVRLENWFFPDGPRLSRDSVWRDEDRPSRKDPLLELKALLRDVSIAMDGNFDGRKSGLEPDVYAEEQLRTEHIRIGYCYNYSYQYKKIEN